MGISVKNMRVITDNNRWVRVNHGSPHKRPGRSLPNKCLLRSGKDKWKSFKKKSKKQTFMSKDNLIIKIKDKTYVYPPKAGVIIFNSDKTKILIVKNAYNPLLSKWGLPKGHLEKNETRIECAKRELLEETGIDLDITPNDPFVKINNSIYYVYKTGEKKFDIKPVDTNEVNEALFVDIKDIKNLKINRELNVAITTKLKLAKKLAKEI